MIFCKKDHTFNKKHPYVGWWNSMIWFILHCKIHNMSTSQSDMSCQGAIWRNGSGSAKAMAAICGTVDMGLAPYWNHPNPIPISFHLGEIDSVDTSIYLNWIIEYPSLLTCITYRTTAPPNGDAVVLQLLTKYIYHSHYINHWHSWDGDWKLLGQLFGTFLRVCFVTS